MLELIDIETFYGRKQVLFGIHLKLSEGGAAALIGRNGMGKTTTVRSIMGFTPARRGRIIFDGREITGFPSYQIARAGIGVVPEGRQIFPTLTVYENLIVPLRIDTAAGLLGRYREYMSFSTTRR